MNGQQLTALVSGAGRGLGVEICRQLLEADINVVKMMRSCPTSNQQHCHGYMKIDVQKPEIQKPHIQYVYADLRNPNAISYCLRELDRKGTKIDILVNNAGVYLDDPRRGAANMLSLDLNLLEETMKINLIGCARLAWGVMPNMLQQGYGRIVNVSSGLGRMGDFDLNGPFYRLSKLALNGLTVLLAESSKGADILVNAVCPGWVSTDMGGYAAPRSVAEGARGVVWAALLPEGGPTGGLFRDGKQLDWFAPTG